MARVQAGDSIDVLGVRVNSVSLDQATRFIEHRIRAGQPGYITCTGMHGVMESREDDTVLDVHNGATLVVPDGMPLVWLNRYYGRRHVDRVYGPDLLLSVCARSVEPDAGFRHFFYGGAPGVPEELASRMQEKFPGLRIAGAYSPPYRPLTPEEDDDVVRMIQESGADIVWIGLSTPKQELWMADHVDKLAGPVLIGVGAAFDFHTGRLVQAPRWIQRAGLEWLFRLLAEPRRLWKRYFKNVPLFLSLVLLQMAGIIRSRNGRPRRNRAI